MKNTIGKNDDVKITKHAENRAKERLSWGRKAIKRMAVIALSKGEIHKNAKGRLNRYLNKIYLNGSKANNVRIYGEVIYLFHNNILITVLQLPKKIKAKYK